VEGGERVAEAIARVGEQHRVVTERVAEIAEARAVLFAEPGETIAEKGDERLFLVGDADHRGGVEPDDSPALLDQELLEVGEGGERGHAGAAVSMACAIRVGCTT
jgi:hypothetical protein